MDPRPTNYLRQNIVFSYPEMIRVSFSLFNSFSFGFCYFKLLLIFIKIILLLILFFHENYFDFFMFRDVPACSGMFHVPGFINAPAYIRSRQMILSWDVIYKQKFQKIKKNACASAFNNYHATIIHLKQFITYFLFYFLLIFNGLAINPHFGTTLPNQNSKFVPIKRTRQLKDKLTWAKRLFCSNHK